MKCITMTYSKEKGWSHSEWPDLDGDSTLVMIFGSSNYIQDKKPIEALKAHFKRAKIIGCSTAGEIFQTNIIDNSLVVAVLVFERATLKVASSAIANAEQSSEVGKKIAGTLNAPDLKHIIVLSDGLNVNGTALVKSIQEHVQPFVQISGGLAGDGVDFKQTWVIQDGLPANHVVTAVGLYGDHLLVGYGTKGGWTVLGPERMITRSKGNVVYEIDEQPALDLYKKYLGEKANELPSSALLFPLSIREDSTSQKRLVRTILSINEEEKSMTFAGDIPENWQAQFMMANKDRLIEGAYLAGEIATIMPANGSDTLVLAVSCVGRRLVLGERTEEELEATLSSFLSDAKQIGFYSYGEISPFGYDSCNLHNQTMTLTSIAEK